MPERISITNRAGEYDTISEDPAASTSSSSHNDNTNPAGSSSVVTSSSDPISQSQRSGNDTVFIGNVDNDQRDTTTATNNNDNNQSSTTTTRRPSQAELEQRMSELRVILPDASDEELRQMLGENDQASRNTRQSMADANIARRTTQVEAATASLSQGSSTRNTQQSSTTTTGGSRRSRRSWHPCQAAPSRPGVFSVGGPVQGGNFNIGETDPIELEIKRIEAVSQVQEALNEKLGYNLRESGQYEEMDRQYKEGERMLAATGLERREKKLLPIMYQWGPPAASRKSLMKKEPCLPPQSEPLEMPLTFGSQESGNSGICVGKFILLDADEKEEHKREEVDESKWADVSADTSFFGPYDQVVRCWKCKATLKVHIEVGLVACPRCRSVSPATDIVIIR